MKIHLENIPMSKLFVLLSFAIFALAFFGVYEPIRMICLGLGSYMVAKLVSPSA